MSRFTASTPACYEVMQGLCLLGVLVGELVYLRRGGQNTSGCVRLCPSWGVAHDRYVGLFPSVRNIVRCYATIISARSAVLTGTAAACVLGIPFLGNTSNLKTIYLTLPGRMKPSARYQWGGHVSYTARVLPECDIVYENGIRVTSIARTFLDLVVLESEEMAVSFIEAAFYLKRASKTQVMRELMRMPALHGKPRALRLVATTRENSESLYETKARLMIEYANLSCVESIETQAHVSCGGTVYRIDILINGFLGVEIDGRCKTRNNPHALINERVREKRIQNQGYIIIRYHPDELTSAFITDITRILTNHKRQAA
ncbi:hypothetical protein CMUST_02955 [Corynebacterium mustelae]|uniref:DUF559 domain-containing protein n=1 Tax=Corynebacterium mustelae TaxID=571915 RepID=A0A0G3GWM6_9CORY|nr:hypothetical protein [Corynebacterium mustelae]AKK04935.1 hypothetical protein CMUST_02955 [Corynebacterium mustelae]